MKAFLILLLIYTAVTVVNILIVKHAMKLIPSKMDETDRTVIAVAIYFPIIHLACFFVGIIAETRMLFQTIIAKRHDIGKP